MRRFVSFLLTFTMLIGMLPMMAWADTPAMNGTHGENLSWNYDESTSTLTVSGVGDMASCESNVYPWKDLASVAKTVELGSGITCISDYAFDGMFEMTEVIIPDTVTAIGDFAFYGCASINEITIPDSVTSIGDYAFNDCEEITSVTFPEDITYIGEYAFWWCVGITEITFLGDAPDVIGENTFGNVTAAVYYPAQNDTWTENIKQNYGGTIEWIPYGEDSVHSHSYTTAITVPTCTEQGYTTYFCECGDSFVSDYVDAAGHSYGEWFVTIASTQDTDGEERRDCSGCEYYETRTKEKLSTTENASGMCGEGLIWVLADNVLTISGEGAMNDYTFSRPPWFENRYDITSVIMGNGITHIGAAAFFGFGELTSMAIPESVLSIGSDAFSGSGLTSIIIPNGVQSIESYTFADCWELTSIVVPDSITTIKEWAFNHSGLTDIYYAGTEEQWEAIDIANAYYHGMGSSNVELFEATIHYKSVSSDNVLSPTVVNTFDNRTYEVYDISMTWAEAKEYCKNLGGHLVTITSAEEQAFIESLLPNPYTKHQYWLGATSESGSWKWITGESFSYSNWDAQEPNYSKQNGKAEQYLQIYNEPNPIRGNTGCRFAWNDAFVDNVYEGEEDFFSANNVGFICEYGAETGSGSVQYFREWNAEKQTAYFGVQDVDDDIAIISYQVTEETDMSFLENIDSLLNTYVLVESRPSKTLVFVEELISIRPVETKVGIVTSADEDNIVIDGENYATPVDLVQPESCVGKFVSYYVYDGTLVQIKIMDTMEGILIKWDPETDEMTIRKTGNSDLEINYIFAGHTDQVSVDFLNGWNWQNKAYEEVTATVNFNADRNYVYRIDGEITRKSDFNEKIYRADYLLSDVGNNLNFYMGYIKDYSPSRMILGANEIGNASDIWREITLVFDTFADGGALAKYAFEQVDVYETILLNALEVSVGSDSAVSWGVKTTKAVTQETKTILKSLQAILELKDDWSIATNSNLDTMTLEMKMMLKNALQDVLKEGQYTGYIFAMSDASGLLDSIMSTATTVEDYVNKILTYEKLWELTDSMALVLDEMYAKTPKTLEYWAMRDALTFCSKMIRETSQEQFEDGAILRVGFFASGVALEKGISHIWGKVMDRAKAANPELAIFLFAYKAGRTAVNVVCNVDNISEQVFKIKVINQYGAALDSATYTLADRYKQNKSVLGAEALISALSLQFGLSYEDCNVAYAYADAVDDALLYKINEFITKETGKTDPLKTYSTNRKKNFHNFSVEASTYWVFDLEVDYPELYPVYSDLIDAGVNDDVLVVPITSSYAIKCPVDVFVYDRNGNLIVDLNSNMLCVSDYVLAIKAGDHKYINLYNNQEYRIACVGYDDGTMSIDISEHRGLEEIRTAFFNNLTVKDETVYETVTKTNPSDKIIHSVVCGSDIINADFDSNIQNDTSEHTHAGGTATCMKKAICTACGEPYGELATHDYEKHWKQGDANGHWHECKNCSAHDIQVKHTPGVAATEDTAQFCTVCGYVITPALGHTCAAGTKWYSNGTYHWHLCTSCGAWAKTSYHSYSGDTDESCNTCGYVRTVTTTEPTEETEAATSETTEATDPDEEVIATETVPTIASKEVNENLSDNAISEDTDSHGISGVLIIVFAIVAFGSLLALAVLLIYKKRKADE